ncbi:unnamed protein product, partial [Amoebophrya sp. A25]
GLSPAAVPNSKHAIRATSVPPTRNSSLGNIHMERSSMAGKSRKSQALGQLGGAASPQQSWRSSLGGSPPQQQPQVDPESGLLIPTGVTNMTANFVAAAGASPPPGVGNSRTSSAINRNTLKSGGGGGLVDAIFPSAAGKRASMRTMARGSNARIVQTEGEDGSPIDADEGEEGNAAGDCNDPLPAPGRSRSIIRGGRRASVLFP